MGFSGKELVMLRADKTKISFSVIATLQDNGSKNLWSEERYEKNKAEFIEECGRDRLVRIVRGQYLVIDSTENFQHSAIRACAKVARWS